MTPRSEKQLHTTRKARLLISLIEECCRSGDYQGANFLCKFTMPFWSSIPKRKRTKLSQKYLKASVFLSKWETDEDSKSPSA